uniref:Uncharacterized protein n=1 Tax=Vaucheria litorea TaxID=109269 RepID=H6WBC3_VAULI|nr:hypothetical protein [Vaucheria litorea]
MVELTIIFCLVQGEVPGAVLGEGEALDVQQDEAQDAALDVQLGVARDEGDVDDVEGFLGDACST